MRSTLLSAGLACGIALAASGPAHAADIYSITGGTLGNQTYAYPLGLDFQVNAKVDISSLGVFTAGAASPGSTLTAALYNMDGATPQQVATATFGSGASYAVTAGGYATQSISTVTLNPGRYQLASWGFGNAAPNYNAYGGGASAVSFANLDGALTAIGTHYNTATPTGAAFEAVDLGPTRYGSATFEAVLHPGAKVPPGPVVFPSEGVYSAPSSLVGNQAWTGSLGLNFAVTNPAGINISALGLFVGGNTAVVSTHAFTAIYSSTGAQVIGPVDFYNASNPTGASFIFQDLHRLYHLAPGTYQVTSWGYGPSLPNYNAYNGTTSAIGFDMLGGGAHALGSVYNDPGVTGFAQQHADSGALRYGAGSFIDPPAPVPEPASLALLGAGLLGLSLSRRKRG